MGLNSFEALFGTKSYAELSLSQDGSELFYFSGVGKKKALFRAKISDLREARQFLPSEISIKSSVAYGGASYTQSEEGLYYVGEDKRLYFFDFSSKTVSSLTPEFLALSQVVLSPSGQWLLFLAEESESACNVYIMDSKGQASPQRVSKEPWYAFNPVFSPDEKVLAWQEWHKGTMPWYESSLAFVFCDGIYLEDKKIKIAGKRYQSLSKKNTSFTHPQFSPDGKWLSYLSDESLWRRLYLAKLDSLDEAFMTSKEEFEIGGPDWVAGLKAYSWSDDAKSIIYLQHAEAQIDLLRFSIEEKKIDRLSYKDKYIHDFSLRQEHLAILSSSSTSPAKISVLNLQSAKPLSCLDEQDFPLDHSLLRKADLHETVSGRFKLRSLFYRAKQENKKPAAAIFHVHGGPTDQVALYWRAEAQFFINQGYHYISVNYRGSSAYGRKFQDALNGGWGVYDLEDLNTVAKDLIRQGLIDPQKLILLGGSAGGYSVLSALAQAKSPWLAGICLYGISDLVHLETEGHRFEQGYTGILLDSDNIEDPVWKERSALSHPEKINKALLLFHGAKDPVVPIIQARVLFKKLQSLGKNSKLVEFSEEAHGFKFLETKKKMYDEIKVFLNHLL